MAGDKGAQQFILDRDLISREALLESLGLSLSEKSSVDHRNNYKGRVRVPISYYQRGERELEELLALLNNVETVE